MTEANKTEKRRLYIAVAAFAVTVLILLSSLLSRMVSFETLQQVIRSDQLIVQEQLREGCK